MVSFIPRLLSTLLIAALAALLPARAGTPGEVVVGQVLRDATLQGLNGPTRKLSAFRGKPLIINVWASWCGPCREEMASLERLAWSDAGRHFAVVGISTDDDPAAAKAWLKRSNATFNHFLDSRLLMENMLGATQIPLTVLVDADGRVVQKVFGAKPWDSPEALRLIGKAFRNKKIATPS
jgi:thiol-disulfide isomerase/thioredoxin